MGSTYVNLTGKNETPLPGNYVPRINDSGRRLLSHVYGSYEGSSIQFKLNFEAYYEQQLLTFNTDDQKQRYLKNLLRPTYHETVNEQSQSNNPDLNFSAARKDISIARKIV